MTAPSIRASALIHDGSTGQDGGIHTGTMPATVQDGDVGVLVVLGGTGSATATVSGWTAISGPDYVDANLATYTFVKDLTAAEAGSTVTVTWSAPAFGLGVLAVVQDADPASGVAATVSAQAAGGTSVTTSAITTAEVDCAVLQFAAGRVATGTVLGFTQPPSNAEFAEAKTARTSSPNFALSGAYRTAPTAGTYGGTNAWTASASTTGAIAVAVALTPAPPNVAPTANAGADQSVSTGTLVTLSGSDSDTDGTVVTRAWSQVSGTLVTLSGASTATATFTPTVADTYVFEYVVTDNDGASSPPDQVTVTATATDNGLRVYVVDGAGAKQECDAYVVDATGTKQQIAMKG